MILRAFYSSPLRAYPGSQHDAIMQATLGLMRIRHVFHVCYSIDDMARQDRHCVWSPLIEGDIIRAQMEWHDPWKDHEAEAWCIEMLGRCNALIKGDSIPRAKGAKSFCDQEESWARDHGLRIIPATDIEHGWTP